MYERIEGDIVRRFYRVDAVFYDDPPPGVDRLADLLATKTGLARRDTDYPVAPGALAETAGALQECAHELFDARLDAASPDPAQLDRFLDEHLIDPRVRDLFGPEGYHEDAPEERHRAYAELRGRLGVPKDTLLYYALGAWLGEWLVRQLGAAWVLHPPVRPIQSFPDFVGFESLVCALPFSLAVKSLADPETGRLAGRIAALEREVVFPPVALAASIADVSQILEDLLPPAAAQARDLLQRGETGPAFERLARAVESAPDNGHLLDLAARLAREHGEHALAHHCLGRQMQLAPHSPRVLRNFAELEARREGGLPNAVSALERALELDPHDDELRLSLARCLKQEGRGEEAAAHARYLAESKSELADDARALL